MTIARTAAAYGAHVASRTKVTGFLREGDRVVGVRARDLENDVDLEIRARVVINAAGVWTDEIQEMVGGRGAMHVEASKGIHLVVPRDRIRSECGFITKTEKSVLFVIPWGRHWIIGTTDTAVAPRPGAPGRVAAPTSTTCSSHVNKLLRTPLDHDDVEGVYAGLRPLLKGEVEADLEDLPRAHRRRAGARAGADRRRQAHHLPGDGRATRSTSRAHAALDRRRRRAQHHRPGAAARRPAASRPAPTSGWRSRAQSGLDLALDRPPARPLRRPASTRCSRCSSSSPELAEPLVHAEDYLGGEVVYAVTHEGARHLDDVLTRRTRISIETFDRGVLCAPPGRRADGRSARLGPGPDRRGGRPLPAPGRGRAAVPGEARPTRRPTRPGSRRPRAPGRSEAPGAAARFPDVHRFDACRLSRPDIDRRENRFMSMSRIQQTP